MRNDTCIYTAEHKQLFREIIKIRRELGKPECSDVDLFRFDCDLMRGYLKMYEEEKIGRHLLKEFAENPEPVFGDIP